MMHNTAKHSDTEKQQEFVLRLYVAGASPNSLRAVNNLKDLLERNIPGRYLLDIIDVHQQKELAEKNQLIALPLLIRIFPLPVRKLIGDMSATQKVIKGLGLKT